jgi:SAM-dependent methyltransferase
MPDVQAKLERGALVADVGCGQGRALIKLAQTYPQSRYVGYDLFAPSVAKATANAKVAGLADRVRFEHLDVSEGLPERYDIITTFDVVHDAVSPLRLLRAIREGLRPEGRYVCMEANGALPHGKSCVVRFNLLFSSDSALVCPPRLQGHSSAL